MTSDNDTTSSKTDQIEAIVHDDEPTSEDRLERRQYAKALARLAVRCKTPLVIGIYGTWGVGKTSLMQLIEHEINTAKALCVWFDPWQHQFDENPVVALAHTLVANLKLEKLKEEGKKLLSVISIALGSRFLKAPTSLTVKELPELGDLYEKERCQIREAQVPLREHFERLVQRVKQQESESKRLVLFIDDLDRCRPDEILKLLEALKLYLNIEGCVYFLGVDRDTLEQSIKHRYKDGQIRGVDYLDKIVQLPFTVPLIEPQLMGSFVDSLLSEEVQSCRELLVEGLGHNPRQVKRFINTLALNHQLAMSQEMPDYDPKLLALLLLIQLTAHRLYDRICRQPSLLTELKDKPEERGQLLEKLSPRPERLHNAFSQVDLPGEEIVKRYIYLTRVTGVAKEEERDAGEIDLRAILSEHEAWLRSQGAQGERADLSEAKLSEAKLSGANLCWAGLRGADLRGADLSLAKLSMADLRGAHLRSAKLSEARLRGAHLRRANLSEADLSEAKLSMADLRGADLRGADLTMANLSLADLRGVNLRGADLTMAKLRMVRLREADLRGADMTMADLHRADLRWADLRGAHLRRANLSEANLSEADLSEAKLHRADLRGADLADATITHGQLATCKTYEDAILPVGLRPEST